MAVINIKVPKTPKSAFDKNRPASGLLKAQLEHLEAAAGRYPNEASTRRVAAKSLTEGEVAERIQALTRDRFPIADEPAAPVAADQPLEPPSASARRSAERPRKAARKPTAKKSAAKQSIAKRSTSRSTARKGGRKTRKKG